MSTSLRNTNYLSENLLNQSSQRKLTLRPYLSPTPRSSNNSPYKSKIVPNTMQSNTPQQKNPFSNLDQDAIKLITKLTNYRQNLMKKLHSHTLIYNTEPLNKCIKHGCYFSVYNRKSQKLLCAQCYTNIQKQKEKKKIVSILTKGSYQHKQKIAKKQEKSQSPYQFDHIKKSYMPLQKSKQFLQKDLRNMKMEIHKQKNTLQGIQNILYQGFNEEKKQLDKSLSTIDSKYEQAYKKLKQSHNYFKQNIINKFKQQWNKHQLVIKQLGLIRVLINDYLSELQQNPNFQLVTPHSYPNYPENNKSRQKYNLLNHFTKQTSLQSNQLQNIRETVYKYTIYSQLNQSLKFSQSQFIWSKQKHKNYIKEVSQKIEKDIGQLLHKIQKIMCQNQLKINL